MEIKNPEYIFEDLQWLIQGFPAHCLWGKRIFNTIEHLLDVANSHGKFLRHYPSVACELLEDFYGTKRGLSVLSPALLRDLLTHHGERGAAFGLWLTLMNPAKEYAPIVRELAPRFNMSQPLLDLCIQSFDHTEASSLLEHNEAIGRLRSLISEIQVIHTPLRKFPSPEVIEAIKKDLEPIRDLYRQGDRDGALRLAKLSIDYEFRIPYVEWRKTLVESK